MSAPQRTAGRRNSDPLTGGGDDWRTGAACTDYDPEIWFPVGDANPTLAVTICQDCPVLDQCRDWAYEHAITYGVWGGETEDQRRNRLAGRPGRGDRLHRCEHCQKVYVARRPEQRYCGHACHHLAMAHRTGGYAPNPGCGTPSGARRHRKHGEPVDELCRYAESLYRAQHRARKEVPA